MKDVYSTFFCMFGIPLDGGYDFQMRVKSANCLDQVLVNCPLCPSLRKTPFMVMGVR